MNRAIICLGLIPGLVSLGAQAADAVQELEDVLVTAASINDEEDEPAAPATILSGDELSNKIGQTLGETLKNELGISNQSFGSGVGRPVIRGQSGPRVKVMQNGLGNNDLSNLSPDHANSVEPIVAERIEVLRGPAALLYGSGAIGGVVNVIDNRIPEALPEKPLTGAAEQRYGSVNNQSASTVKLEGGADSLAFHLDGFYRGNGNMAIGGPAIDEAAARATDLSLANIPVLQNSTGVLNNSNAHGEGASAGMSWLGSKGFLGAAINQLNNNYGIPPDGSGGDPVRIDMSQTQYNLKGQWNKPLPLAESLRYKFGYTDYQHVELDNGAPATRFTNKSVENRLELKHQAIGNWQGMLGFQSVNSQFAALGEEAVVPRSDIASYGAFLLESIKRGQLTYQFGLRGESASIKPDTGGDFSYAPVSGSASALWDINDHHRINLAFTHSERAPQVQELLSNGVHEATRSYELGNDQLAKELSNNLELSYRYQADWLSAELNLFHTLASDYIFQRRDSLIFNRENESFAPTCPVGASCLPVLVSSQADAIFKGFEAKINLPLLETRHGLLDMDLFSDYTRGEFASGGDVPRMPPLRYGTQLNYLYDDWSLNLRLTRAETQNHAGDHESPTPGYVLLDLNTQYSLADFHGGEVLLFVKGKNLLDENIRNSTSYLRNFAPEPGRGAELGIRISY